MRNLQKAAERRMDLRMMVLGSGLGDYRRSVQHWWGKLEEAVSGINLWERPIYFVSSNTHSIINLITGLSWELQHDILDYVRRENPEDLLDELAALPEDDDGHLHNFLYYASRPYLTSLSDQEQAERTRQ